MAVRITVTRAEFTQAESDGEVWGQYLEQKPNLFVYALLGVEREYIPRDGDDLRADYKLFTNCYVEYYRTMEDLKADNAIPSNKDEYENDKLAVIILC